MRYAEGLPSKWRVTEEALELLRAGDVDAEDTLRRIAHQVRGSAASFGFVDIDKAATRVEYAKDRQDLERAAASFVAALRAAYSSESTTTTRVLLVDDDLELGFVMTSLLGEENLVIIQVTTVAAALDELRARSWSLVFVDLVLPDADGRALLANLRSLPLHRDTPVVILSAKTTSLVRNECAVYGIDDFIEKPIDAATFAVRVSAVVERTRSMKPLSLVDELTGLPNRLGLRRALTTQTMINTAALAVVDVVQFEAFARAAGQVAGDEVLKAIAKILRGCIRDTDLLARWGGAEFLVALPGLGAFEAVERLGHASDTLRERALGAEIGPPLSLRAGITTLEAGEALDYALLRADQLLHQAKRGDRERWYAHSLESTGDGRPRILLAEDDPGIASLLLHDLSDDFEVTHAPDGEVALELAESAVFDLVLLDYQMPRRDGIEVVKELRQNPEYLDKPILLLTSVGSDVAVEAAFEAGADDYINKPYRRRPLLARLTRHLGRTPTQPEADPEPPAEAVDTEVTVMFCDISGFTKISASLPPREVLALLNAYFPVIAKIVADHGGLLEKYIGDAIMAIWGAPRASEDDAINALSAAVEIQRAVEQLGETERPLRVHIGLNSGPVVAGNIGGEGLAQYATIGDTTNIASRICDVAGPGQIALSEDTVVALEGRSRWPLSAPERMTLDGRTQPTDIYRVRWY